MSDLMAQYNTYRLERIRLIAEEDHIPDQERMRRIRAVLGADLNSHDVMKVIGRVPALPAQGGPEPCRPFLARSQPQVASYEYRDDGADGEIP